jgi:hypothetical protein
MSKDVHVGLALGSWQHPCQPVVSVGCGGETAVFRGHLHVCLVLHVFEDMDDIC